MFLLSEGSWGVPASFKRGFGYVSGRNHLFSRSNPHDGPVVTLGATVQFQAGEASPGEGHLWRQKNTFGALLNLQETAKNKSSLKPPG